MNYATFDLTRLPLIAMKINNVVPDIKEYQACFKQLTELLERYETLILVVDTQDQKLLPSEHRIYTGQWMKTYEKLIKDKVRVLILEKANIWVSMLLKAIALIKPFPVPVKITSSEAETSKVIAELSKV